MQFQTLNLDKEYRACEEEKLLVEMYKLVPWVRKFLHEHDKVNPDRFQMMIQMANEDFQ